MISKITGYDKVSRIEGVASAVIPEAALDLVHTTSSETTSEPTVEVHSVVEDLVSPGELPLAEEKPNELDFQPVTVMTVMETATEAMVTLAPAEPVVEAPKAEVADPSDSAVATTPVESTAEEAPTKTKSRRRRRAKSEE